MNVNRIYIYNHIYQFEYQILFLKFVNISKSGIEAVIG